MQKENWQQITLGDLYRNTQAKFRQARRQVRHLAEQSPIKVEVDSQKTTNLLTAGLNRMRQFLGKRVAGLLGGSRPALPSARELEATPTTLRRKPWQTRTEQLEMVLAEAWAAGSRTYAQLLEWVRTKTGQGCSHRAIARFRKSVQPD